MAPSKMKLRVKKRDTRAKSSQRLLANASPDSKCPICLDGFNNVASLDRCLHQFCFRCIHEWSKNKAECPLCKQPFHSIFHSVKGENDFKEFVLPQVENGAPPNAATATERVLRPRALRGRERRSHRLQVLSSSSLLDGDVMFDSMSNAATLTDNQDVQQMVLNLTARRRRRGEGRSLGHLRDQDVVAFRRALYRMGVRVRNTRDTGRQRDISAAFLRQNPTCLHRLLPWLQRELTVLYGSHGSLVNIVQHIIMSRITNYNMEDSVIQDELRPFLLARTDHFLHELVSFARSTLSMEAYDQQAIYDCPAPSYEEGSNSDSSVIAISEDEGDNDRENNVTENPSAGQENLPLPPTAAGTQSLLGESAWDDETPGPSYSTLLPSSSQSQHEGVEPSIAPEQTSPVASVCTAAGLGAGDDDEEEECLIVGYVKPMAERTPELVQLSSDSSEEEQEMDTAPTVTKTEGSHTQLLTQCHTKLLSPASSPGLAPTRSPQCTPLDTPVQQSCSRERATRSHSPSSWDHRMLRSQHRSRTGSRSCSRSGRKPSVFNGHQRHKKHSHQYSHTQEHAGTEEPSQPAKSHDGSCVRSPVSWSGRSPTTPLWSDSYLSPSRNDTSSNRSRERSRHGREQHSHLSSYWEKEQERTRRRRRNRRQRSPDSDSFIGLHHLSSHSRESQHSRKRRRWSFSSSSSSSSSSADSRCERSRLDKPSGKCKYKTRHLERVAQHQQGERSVATDKHKDHQHSREQPLSRSSSVEIIYERKAPNLHCHQRKKRRHRKRKREQHSPVVITIDSDSDLTIDCLDRVLDVVDQTGVDINNDQRVHTDENTDPEHIQETVIQNTLNASALSSSNSVLNSSTPVTLSDRTAVSPDRTLNLDDCLVDHSSSDPRNCTRNIGINILCSDNHTEAVSATLLPMVSMTTTPPSDTRLLESILQDLEEFLPGVEHEAEPKRKSPLIPGQQKYTASPQQDISSMPGSAASVEKRHTDDGEQETEAS